MNDGSITFNTALDNKQLERELSKLRKDIAKAEESTAGHEAKKSPLIQQAHELEQKMKAARAEVERYRTAWTAGVAGADKEQSTAIMKAQQLEAEHTKIVAQIDKIDSKLQPAYTKMDGMKVKAGGIAHELGRASIGGARMSSAIQKAGKSLDRFKMRLKEVVRSALIFTLITQALAQFRSWMGKVIRSNAEASAAVAKLKGALLTLAQPILNVILPAFTMFANVLTNIITKISTLVSTLFGTTIDSSREAAKGLYEQTDALEATGGAAKKASKYLAGFDEVNKISGDSSTGGSGAGSNDIKPDFSGLGTGEVKEKVEELTVYLMGALLALGSILAFTGANIPLGIGLMAFGAVGLASEIAENWGAMSPGLQTAITNTLLMLATAGLVIGAILAFTGANIPLGIGLMVAGAAALGVAAALNWEAISQALQGPIGIVVAVVSGALLALGAALAFTGVALPLGIALMAAGAAGLATVVALNWDTISTALQGPIGAVVAVVSVALLAIGAALAFSGAALPLGIALMAAGAIGLATVVALNWDTVSAALQGPIGKVVAAVSGALLALGVLLAFTGAALPLGIALIAAGAIGLVTVGALNFEAVVSALQGPIGKVVAIASGILLVLGLVLAFTGVALPLGVALIAAGAAGLVTVGALNWDAILDKMKELWSNIKNWWNTSVSKFFTAEFWLGLGKDMLNGLFNGLSAIGSKISEWGSSFISGVKDFFGIHSPSTEFESLGGYMMAGLQNGVTDNTKTTETAFSAMFDAIVVIEESSLGLMQTALVLFLAYLTGDFLTAWKTVWQTCYSETSLNIRKVISEIDILSARLASIERNIVIAVTTVHDTASGGGPTASSGRAKVASSPLRSFALPEIPHLASGSVIPPNREFMALLGDQKSGTNIEAPMSTIKQGVREVMAETGGSQPREIILRLVSDRGFVRSLKVELDAESQRSGVKLVRRTT